MYKRFGIMKGVNLGGWLSQCNYSEERLMHFITEEDFARIAAWGLDHVRLPVDYNVLEDEQGGYREDGFERIRFAVSMCTRYGLKLIIDLHKTYGFSFDKGEMETGLFTSAAHQERFCRLWEEIARRFGQQSDFVAFELLNEVTSSTFMDAWNRISGQAIHRIRAIAPDTLILVGSYHYNAAAAVPALATPADDRVIYNFHCYEPIAYTHQGAPWVEMLDQSVRIAFEHCGATEAYFEQLFAPAIAAAAERGTTLYCGECGVIDRVAPEDAIKWFRTICAVFNRHHIPHCVWNYKQLDFGLTDARWDALRSELMACL